MLLPRDFALDTRSKKMSAPTKRKTIHLGCRFWTESSCLSNSYLNLYYSLCSLRLVSSFASALAFNLSFTRRESSMPVGKATGSYRCRLRRWSSRRDSVQAKAASMVELSCCSDSIAARRSRLRSAGSVTISRTWTQSCHERRSARRPSAHAWCRRRPQTTCTCCRLVICRNTGVRRIYSFFKLAVMGMFERFATETLSFSLNCGLSGRAIFMSSSSWANYVCTLFVVRQLCLWTIHYYLQQLDR